MKRSTWIVLIIFVILGAVAVFLPQALEKAAQAAATPTPTVVASSPLFVFAEAAITGVVVSDAQGNEVEVARAGQEWNLVKPAEMANASTIQNAITQLAALTIVNQFEASANLADLGLDAPAYTITITVENGLPRKLFVGSQSPTGRVYYVQLEGDAPLAVNKYSLQTVVDLLINPPIATPTEAASEPLAPEGTATPSP